MTWSRNRNFATHSTPKPAMLAAMTRSVESDIPFTRVTSRVDSRRPASVNTQNGRISRRRLTLPSRLQTQRLLSTNAGTAATDTAVTFDQVGSASTTPTMTNSTAWVTTTPTTDTIE